MKFDLGKIFMNFTSLTFLCIFLPVVLAVYYMPMSNFSKNIFLLFASLVFYASGEPLFVFVMIFSIIFNYIIAKRIHGEKEKRWRKIVLICGLSLNFAILGVFKYTDFFISAINDIFNIGIPFTNIPLPIGISFFTFQAVSYILDVYFDDGLDDNLHYQENLMNFALYISMFPQLVAGPIVRYSDIAVEMRERRFDMEQIADGCRRFILGLSKKILIANNMAIVADRAFSLDVADAGSPMLLLGAVSYTLQIYFDFSGYCDMAIGIGKMLGFTFPENFNYPYTAKSITDFWRRWHMTLSKWFRDYLYIPLGGSRSGYKRTILNLFVVWTLTGLWHGANWTFVMWGLIYFALLVFEKYFKQIRGASIEKILPSAVGRVYTMFFVVIAWIFFRSESVGAAFEYLKGIVDFTNVGMVKWQAIYYIKEFAGFYLAAVLSAFGIIEMVKGKLDANSSIYIIGRDILLVILFLLSFMYIIKGSFNPFIYFNF